MRTAARSTSRFRASSCSAFKAEALPETIVLSANSDWNIANFRSGLIKALQAAGFRPVVIAPKDPAADQKMRALNVERIPISINRAGLNPLNDLGLLATYRRLLRDIRPAAYLGYTIKPNVYGSLASASLGIPALPNVSGLGTAFMRSGPLQELVKRLYRFGFRRAPVVFFQNREDRDLFVDQRLVTLAQAQLLPGSGVDLDHFAPTAVPEEPPTFLLIGRLLRDKGVVEYVEAARVLKAELPKARFQVLGPVDNGNRTAVTAEQLARWAEEGLIEYLGSADDVRPFIARSNCVVLPSYREGLPRSLLEGAAMGRPLIATDVPGCRDVVEEARNGYLCEARNPLSLAEAMRRMADLQPQERLAMGTAGRRMIEERFSEKVVIQTYIDILDRLRDRRPQL